MIVQETVVIDGHEFTRTYSDANRYVVRDGIAYDEAWDPAEFGRTYTEGDLIPSGDESEDEDETTAREIVDILLGGAT